MEQFLKKLKIKYKNIELYQSALTHSSYGYENNETNNERLEFLGDAVIELLISDYLYLENDEAPEGEMTKRRAQAVREEALVIYGNKIGIQDYLRLGRGEEIKGPNDAMIADAVEALFGAVYLDLGINSAKELLNRVVIPSLDEVLVLKDYKSYLQEIIQSGDKRNLSYQIVKETGPSHDKNFEAVVKLDNKILLGKGFGKTKKEAEQKAAKAALKKGSYGIKKNI